MEMFEERRKMESTAPSATPATMTVFGVEMVVKNTFLEVPEEEVAAKLKRCSTAPGSLTAWSQGGASSVASHSWSGHAAYRVAADRRAAGKVSADAISKKCAQRGDDDNGESSRSTTCMPSSTMTSWTTDREEDYDYKLAQFETPRRLSIAGFAMDTPVSSDAISKKCAQYGDDDDDSPCSTTGTPSSMMSSWTADTEEDYDYELAEFETPRRLSFVGFSMDTPVRAGGAGAPPAAAAAGAGAKGEAPQAPPKQAPQIVTTIMVQNLKRSVTRGDFMLSLDSQGFAGKYDFVHLPKSFGTARNNGCAFVNFLKREDAEEFARSIACIKGSKMRAVPADVQGSANVAKATSRKKMRIRADTCRPLVVSGHGQDVPLRA